MSPYENLTECRYITDKPSALIHQIINNNFMNNTISDYPLIIVGAGAAGLGASEFATEQQIEHIVLEASHRIGGRGLTEKLAGDIPIDLGCHWMHCARFNPYVKWADKLGFYYEKNLISDRDTMFFDGKWLNHNDILEYDTYTEQCAKSISSAYEKNKVTSIFDAVNSASKWTQNYFYCLSLGHSNDVDSVSVQDVMEFEETYQDYPVREGFGDLIAAQGKDRPVQLNTEVQKIDWTGNPIKITTNKGMITTDKILLTVSTGVLAADAIEFKPALPENKLEAIHNLQMGNSNYLFFHMDEHAIGDDIGESIHYQKDDVSLNIRIKPFGTPCIFTSTAGRFAWWLEKQGPTAAKDFFTAVLCDVFGAGIKNHLNEFKSSAWGFDPWIRGAYASQQPGYQDLRPVLAEPLNETLFFAGEATSSNFMNTAHGAYLSGKQAIGLAFPTNIKIKREN
jgi:monoamine oxidase